VGCRALYSLTSGRGGGVGGLGGGLGGGANSKKKRGRRLHSHLQALKLAEGRDRLSSNHIAGPLLPQKVPDKGRRSMNAATEIGRPKNCERKELSF